MPVGAWRMRPSPREAPHVAAFITELCSKHRALRVRPVAKKACSNPEAGFNLNLENQTKPVTQPLIKKDQPAGIVFFCIKAFLNLWHRTERSHIRVILTGSAQKFQFKH